jgi:hypothetical protein
MTGPFGCQMNLTKYYEVWCEEDGPDGKVPEPDGNEGDWAADECASGIRGYSFKRSR